MGKTAADLVNIVGVALVVGLLLRYATETRQLIEAGGQQAANLYATVSLQNVAK